MEAITCEEFYNDADFDNLVELMKEMAMDEVNFELQVAADEARDVETFERWVEEIGARFLVSEFASEAVDA